MLRIIWEKHRHNCIDPGFDDKNKLDCAHLKYLGKFSLDLYCRASLFFTLFLSRVQKVDPLMVSGHQIRLNRIMKKGRMLCIPMDHGISNGPIEGLENPHKTIYDCENHGLTSVIVNKGIIKTLSRPTKIGILVHFSSSTSLSVSPNRKMLTGSVQEAVRLGADGVSLHINIGGKEEPEMLEQLGLTAEQCHKWNMPLLAMMYPRGQNIKDPHDPQIVGHVARIGAECGADIVKTVYTGDVDSFAKIVKSTPVPIVVAGGPKTKTDLDLLTMTEEVMTAGGRGVTFGRNIFAHKNPQKITSALAAIIFGKATAKEAVKKLE